MFPNATPVTLSVPLAAPAPATTTLTFVTSPNNPAADQVIEYRQTRFHPPARSTVLLLIRHGESAPAREGEQFPLVDGRSDPELAPEGRREAEQVRQRLGDEAFDAVYITPLRRTAQTADPLVHRLGLTPVVEHGLQEVHLGEWEGGLVRKHFAENHPLAHQVHLKQRWDVIPGAEPAEEFGTRVRGAIERLAARHPDQRLAVFTHGGVIASVLSMASGSTPLAFSGADNGSISEVVVSGSQWIVRRYNDTAHLK